MLTFTNSSQFTVLGRSRSSTLQKCKKIVEAITQTHCSLFLYAHTFADTVPCEGNSGWWCRLELQTRNNGKLMVALEEVLARLDLPEDTQDLLQQTDFDDAKSVSCPNHSLPACNASRMFYDTWCIHAMSYAPL